MVYIYKPMARGPTTLVNREAKVASAGTVGTKHVDAPVKLEALDRLTKTPLSGALQSKIERLELNNAVEKKKKKERAKAIHFEL